MLCASRFAHFIRLASRNIFRQRLRTAVTLLAIAFGVAGIILSGGFVQDMFTQLAEAIIHSQSGHIQVAQAGFFTKGSQSPQRYVIDSPRPEELFINNVPGVVESMSRVYFFGLLNNRKTDLPILAEGIEPDREAVLGTYLRIQEGRQLEDKDHYGILLGQGVAHALKLRPGEAATLVASTTEGAMNTLDFEVVGVFQSFSQEYDSRAVKIPLSAAQELLSSSGVNVLVVALRRTPDTEKVARILRRHAVGADLEVRTWEELNDFYQGAVAFYDREFGVLRLVILIMVLLGVANAVNMSAFERVGEFGTMRALGNRGRDISALVLTEGLLTGLIGATLGTALGMAIAIGASSIGIPMPPPPNSNLGYIARIPIVASVVVGAFFVGLGATVLASIVPAIRVSRIPVATALRENA